MDGDIEGYSDDEEFIQDYEDFLKNFKFDRKKTYFEMLVENVVPLYPSTQTIEILYSDLDKSDLMNKTRFIEFLHSKGLDFIRLSDFVLTQLTNSIPMLNEEEVFIHTTIFLPKQQHIHIYSVTKAPPFQLVGGTGVIMKVSKPKKKAIKQIYVCPLCGYQEEVFLGRKISSIVPSMCKECKKSVNFKLIQSDTSSYVPCKIFSIVDTIEVSQDRSDYTLQDIYVIGDDAGDNIMPGSIVEWCGLVDLFTSDVKKKEDSILEIRILITGIKIIKDDSILVITEEEIIQIIEASKKGDMMQRIKKIFDYYIEGYTDIKESLILQTFSSQSMTLKKGYLNILIVGDPGTAKTKLSNVLELLSVKSKRAQLPRISIAGLTGGEDKEGGLTPGVLVLAKNGILILDEFGRCKDDKIYNVLNQPMSDGVVTVTINGKNVTIFVNVSILAIENPKYDILKMNEPILPQINIPPAMLSRFDLIFLIPDTTEHDIEISKKIGEAHTEKKEKNDLKEDAILKEISFIKKYTTYAKRNINPHLTKTADEKINLYYNTVRKMKDEGGFKITARQLESLYIIPKARARLYLRNEVKEEDVDYAIRLFTNSYIKLCSCGNNNTPDFNIFHKFDVEPNINASRLIDDIFSSDEVITNEQLETECNAKKGLDIKLITNEITSRIFSGQIIDVGGKGYKKVEKLNLKKEIITFLENNAKNGRPGTPLNEILKYTLDLNFKDEVKIKEMIETLRKDGLIFSPPSKKQGEVISIVN